MSARPQTAAAPVVGCVLSIVGLVAAALFTIAPASAAEPPSLPVADMADAGQPQDALSAYRALAESRARDYDRAQDISPRQMLALLEVSERTGASLGQLLATGEHESAHTWNDFVRPPLGNGKLGAATGVWQFQPATFHRIIKTYGPELLAAASADELTGRGPMDLGAGPFCDAEVRMLIQDTADGLRDASDESLQLLRHNFAVLAFAKQYLSVDSGARSPVEDYLFHFLGAEEGRRVLRLARGEARNTLSVKPAVRPVAAPNTSPTVAASAAVAGRRTTVIWPVTPGKPPRISSEWGPITRLDPAIRSDRIAPVRSAADVRILSSKGSGAPARAAPRPDATPLASAQWGLPADSPTVRGNLGMFYRDGQGQTQPYTWGEFLEHVARRVKAETQPALVRAKYGVGFALAGGDMPGRKFDPDKVSKPAEFRYAEGQAVLVPPALVTGPLDRDETRRYEQRLAALVDQGESEPTDRLPEAAFKALKHLGVLADDVANRSTTDPQVLQALQAFRGLVGKAEPDDPAERARLMPAERVALELYDQRIARYAELQADQLASAAAAPNLVQVRKMPAALRQRAAPYIALVQSALSERGLLKQPVKKSVWRDKRRKRHVSYKTLAFAGQVDKATLAAVGAFQLRNGLRQTDGVLDALTLQRLGLSPMGLEIFLPPSGPYCQTDGEGRFVTLSDRLTGGERLDAAEFTPIRSADGPALLDCVLGLPCGRVP